MKTVKLGIVTFVGNNTQHTINYKVRIVDELKEHYIIKYVEKMTKTSRDIYEFEHLIKKDEISEIHEREVSNWDYFWKY